MISLTTINVDGNEVHWNYDSAETLAKEFYADWPNVPANDDPVISFRIDGVNQGWDNQKKDFLDVIYALGIEKDPTETVDYENLKVVSAFLAEGVVWAEVADQGRMAYFSFSKEDLYDENYLKDDDIPDSRDEYEVMLRDAIKQFLVDFHPNNLNGQLNIAGLHHITEANPATRYLYEQVYKSGNGMFLVEPGCNYTYEDYDIAPWDKIGLPREEFERQVDEDILRFHLADCIEKKVGDALYTCYGSLSSAFTIDEKRKELKFDYVPNTPVHLTGEQYTALHNLSDAFMKVAELCDNHGEEGNRFNDKVLAGQLGSCWPMSIDEIAGEINHVLSLAKFPTKSLEKNQKKEKTPAVR